MLTKPWIQPEDWSSFGWGFDALYQQCTADKQMTKCESEVEGEVGIPKLLSKTFVKGYCDAGKHCFIGN